MQTYKEDLVWECYLMCKGIQLFAVPSIFFSHIMLSAYMYSFIFEKHKGEALKAV